MDPYVRLEQLHRQIRVDEAARVAREERKRLRDEFAIAFITGLCCADFRRKPNFDAIASGAYEMADAMLKARGDA
jgi:hypothetical protein